MMWESNLKIIISFLFYIIHNGSGLTRIDPLVDSKVGLIRGLRATDGDYSMFMGIPYATVNESNPFGPSIPHPGFDEAFEAYDDSAVCPQVDEFTDIVVGTLDCLHLNIYVPNSANSKNRLPVLVWIHGGGFTIGYSGRYLYGPRFLVKHDIILVTINYRLGPYGFMCLDTPDVPGNQGLKDQLLALKWIKNNIEAFGGDPNKITAFGESAGGASVDFHLLYGHEKLFDKALMQSGTALGPWALVESDMSIPLKLSEQLGFLATNAEEALNFVASVDPHLLIASTQELGLKFRACVEKEFDNVKRFIYDHPVNIKKPRFNNIPILLGYNSDESLAIYGAMKPEDFSFLNTFHDNFKLSFNFDDKELVEMEQLVRHFYIGDEKISEKVKQEITDFDSDFRFNYPVVRTLQRYLNNDVKNLYYYVFFYKGARNFAKSRYNITTGGVAHADEIGYLFDISFMDKQPTPEDQLFIDRLTTLWTNFVKFGNPTPETTDLLPVQWPTATKDIMYYLHVDSELKIEKRNFKSRMTFWDLFYKLNEEAQVGYKGIK